MSRHILGIQLLQMWFFLTEKRAWIYILMFLHQLPFIHFSQATVNFSSAKYCTITTNNFFYKTTTYCQCSLYGAATTTTTTTTTQFIPINTQTPPWSPQQPHSWFEKDYRRAFLLLYVSMFHFVRKTVLEALAI